MLLLKHVFRRLIAATRATEICMVFTGDPLLREDVLSEQESGTNVITYAFIDAQSMHNKLCI